MWRLETYDEELLTIFFDFTNKIEVEEICIKLDDEVNCSLSKEDIKDLCTKIERKIHSLQTQNIVSNDVRFFIFYIKTN